MRTWQRELCYFETAPFPATTSWPRSRGSWCKRRSDSELFDQIFGICGASLSATSRAAGGALHLFYTHPEQLDQLIRNPALIPDALEECFQLASNGYFTFPRIATRDTEVGGTPVLKDTVVRPSPLAPNYDPDVFPNPTRFDIHRRPKRILSFGAGPHHCIGNILGRTTITIAIRSLLERFPKAHLIDPGFTPGLWRSGRRIAAAKPANENPLKERPGFGKKLTGPIFAINPLPEA